MSEHEYPLPTDVHAALLRGETIEAIKLLRHATGIGLKEAKNIIDAHNAGLPVAVPARKAAATPSLMSLPGSGELPADVLDALARDGKIAAIKLLRERTGLGLKEAKDAVEAAPQPPPRRATVEAGAGSGKLAAWLVLIVVGAVAGAWFAGVF